jgi:hypothetical protein
MRFRNLALPALLAVAANVVSFVYDAILLNSIAAKTSQSYTKLLTDFAGSNLLPALALTLFFFFVYAEASGQIKGEARAKAAVVSSSLMVLYVAGKMFQFGLYAFTLWTMPNLSLDRSVLASGFFYLVWNSFLITFLIAFAIKRGTAASRVVPRLAGVLAAFTLYAAVWTSVQLYARHDSLALALPNYAVILFGSATHLLFFVVVWRRWRPDLPTHQNIVS